jgi:hypothetical protein
VADLVQFASRHPGLHMGCDHAQHFGREPAGDAHRFDIVL